MSGAYYNEIEPYAADWLENLIREGHIADGVVDRRSIEDIYPSDLAGFTQCHFFAGIGVWSYALRLAGWPDDRPVWTGSCPCQPFSAAGKGAGFDDERHLWPAWHHLIREHKPPALFGEQVASKDSEPWIDLVQDDMEELGYAFGAVPFPAAGVGAPEIRDRLYWVANAGSARLERRAAGALGNKRSAAQRSSEIGRLAGCDGDGCSPTSVSQLHDREYQPQPCGNAGGLADAESSGRTEECSNARGSATGDYPEGLPSGFEHGSGAVRGYWRPADWVLCRDPDGPTWRPVEPGTFPLAHGAPARVGRLRAYGNAINAEAASAFIGSVM